MSENYTVGVKVTASTEQFKQGMAIVRRDIGQTKQDFASFGLTAADQSKQMDKMLDHAAAMGKGMLVAGGVVAAGVGLVIKSFADYDGALSEFKAASRESDEVVQKVGKAAMAAGQAFGYTAVEALEGATALNKAGVSVADIMGGALTGALTLAATDTMAVGEAAELASIAMTQFKLEGKDVGHVADLLAAGAGKAVGSVSDLGMGLKQSGLVASQFGLSLEETVGSLAAFASQGLVGSDAGTSLKTMLLALANPSKEAKEKMEELGIAAYDANGNFVGMAGLAEQLQTRLGGLTQAQRDQASALIFGNDAIRAANVLYGLGSDGVKQWEKDVNTSGYAAQVAADRLDNLNGDMQTLTTSIQNGFINAGSGANDVMRGMVQGATGLVQWVSALPEPMLIAATVTATLLAGTLLLSGGLLTVIPKIIEYRTAVAAMGPVGQRITGIVGGLGKAMAGLVALGVAVGVIQALGDAARSNLPQVEDFVNAIKTMGASGTVAELFPKGEDEDYYADVAESLGFATAGAYKFNEALGMLKERESQGFLGDIADNLGNIFGQGSQKNLENLRTFTDGLATLATKGDMSGVASGFKALQTELDATDEDLLELIEHSPGLEAALKQIATDAGIPKDPLNLLKIATGEMLAEAQGAKEKTGPFDEAMGGMQASTEETAEALSKFIELLFAAGVNTRSLIETELAFEAAQDDFTQSIEDQISALQGKFEAQGHSTESAKLMAQAEFDAMDKLDKGTEAGRRNMEGLLKIADAGVAYTEKLIGQGKAEEEVQAAMQGTYDGLITAMGQLGITGDAADTLARKLLEIPPGVSIQTWMDQQAEQSVDRLDAKTRALNGRTVSIYTNEYFTRLEQRQFLPDLNGAASGGGRPGLATGGPVTGNGPKGVDSQWRLLAPGEHVWTDKEVDAAGGHGAVEALRAAALHGFTTQQLASAPSAPHAQYSGSSGGPGAGGAGYQQDVRIIVHNPVAEPVSKTLTRKSTLFALMGRPS